MVNSHVQLSIMLKPGKTIVQSVYFLFLILIFDFTHAQAQSTPDSVIQLYFNALKSGDFSKASSYWDPNFITASNRLGISFSDTPAKYDCASTILKNLNLISDGRAKVSIIGTEQNGDKAKTGISVTSGKDTIKYTYDAIRGSDEIWRLTSPAFYHCQDWNTKDTRYTRIFYNDASRLNKYACEAIDKFIDSVGARLKITPARMLQLSGDKIYYYLCNEDEMLAITGFSARGMGDLALDAVITQELPHEHELVHILINFALKENSLYTVPFLQEGLACNLGGRWGRAPAVIHYAGYVNLHFGITRAEDILTYEDFYGKIGSAETSYPVSAIFVNYLMRLCKPNSFRELYRRLSGTDREVRSFSQADIISIIEAASGESWNSIMAGFNDFWPRFEFCGIRPFIYNTPADSTFINILGPIRFSVWKLNFDYLLEIDFSNSSNGCIITLYDKHNLPEGNYQSGLFNEHLPNSEYHGQRYGIKVTASEIGLYDYYCNRLIASYVMGFDMNVANNSSNLGMTRVLMSNNLIAPNDLTDFEIEIIGL
ncbi:MAG: hypothetical protein ABIE07_07365 [Candidatus Zixiibacteriota bacterium]